MKKIRNNIKKTIKKRILLELKSKTTLNPIKTILQEKKEINSNLLLNDIELKTNYDICVIITTYNREFFLKRLLDQINLNKFDLNILIAVFDDASVNDIQPLQNVKYMKYIKNHGKLYYWKLITDTMQFCKQINSKYFIYLPDDVTLVNDFFKKSIKLYENIKDENKICLSLLLPKQIINKTNWTDFKPIEYDEYYKTQWCDLCFISEKKFFSVLDFKINKIEERKNYMNFGSGVGANISIRLFNKNYNMYHTKSSLALHADHESVMNKEIRMYNKLTT